MIELIQLLIYLGRIGLSMVLGLFVGYEREGQKKPAGIRDISLVTLGATLFTIISIELANIAQQFQMPIRYDLGRIMAYTVVGIGFLGSGVIMQYKNKLEGITTAGTLWCMVGIGILVGMGLYSLAIISALAVYFILKLKHIRITFESRRKKRGKKCKKTNYKLLGKK